MGEIRAVEEIRRVYEVVTEVDDVITIEATSDKGQDVFGYTITGLEGIFISVNDTEHIIDGLTRATKWINENSEIPK